MIFLEMQISIISVLCSINQSCEDSQLLTLFLKCEMNCQLSQILVLGFSWSKGVVLVSSVSVKELIEQAFNDTVKFNLQHCEIKYRKQTCDVFIFRLLTKIFSVKMSNVYILMRSTKVSFFKKMCTCWNIHSFNLGKAYL